MPSRRPAAVRPPRAAGGVDEPPRGRRRVVRWLGAELVALVVVVVLASIGTGHAIGGVKRRLLLDDGDSVVLPLFVESLRRGEAFEWTMSPVLFVFPELPLYLVSDLVTTGVAAALLTNAVVNVVVLYLLFRAVTRSLLPAAGQAAAAAAAVAGTALFVGCTLLEFRYVGNTAEIATLFYSNTYYSGTVMSCLATLALGARLLRGDATRRSVVASASGLALVAALSVLSNPLYLLWAVAPAGVALAVTWAVRRTGWRTVVVLAVASLGGSAVGYVGRIPLAPYIAATSDQYFRSDLVDLSASFYRGILRELVTSHKGQLEAAVFLGLVVVSVVGLVVALVRRASGPVTFAFAASVATSVVVPVVVVQVGSLAARYLLPVFFVPLAVGVVSLVVVLERAAARAPAGAARRRVPLLVAAVAVVAAVVAFGTAPIARVVTEARGPGYPAASCLTDWADGRDAVGVGQFWQVRPLQVYGGDDVRLLQAHGDLSVFPWLSNLAPYQGADPSYLVVSGLDLEDWSATLDELGAPTDTVACGDYTIYDYEGAPGEALLDSTVDRSAESEGEERGFTGW
ncbi:hypothetical protein F1C15_14070 [Frigoribacterium sp. NBH87]|uniref:hypothetical protein n=1 Tax=Frigoribacterium sp. NBH87 TaxID=2596916 RepID=UPI001623D7EE|nr:hypothetical protein [Frigoribacterium sp. NBH87]QNE44788.1 hypothetical protein F1C15_14070 [Frigoribacterium sp. NBH87]